MVFYRGWIEAIKKLPEETQKEVFTAIIEYGLNGETTQVLEPVTEAMLEMVKPQIDLNNTRYENGRKGAEYGIKGGRPQQNKTKKKPNKPQLNPNLTPNDNVNVDVNVDVNDNANDNLFSNSDELLCSTACHNEASINYKNIIEAFNRQTNRLFGEVKYPISEQRKGMIRARIREHGQEALTQVFQKAAKSGFLKGDSGKFKATFDWLIRPTNFEKVLTGNYDERNETPNENKVNW